MGLALTKRKVTTLTNGFKAGKYQAPPRTAMQVFEMLPEGTMAEVINNNLYMSPAPTTLHQSTIGKIYAQMYMYVTEFKLGECFIAPVDVYIGHNNAVQPDVVFIANEHTDIIKEKNIQGAPDLIVEALSSNKKRDLQLKKKLYETFGVKEYFIVNPTDKEVITYYHDGKKFILQQSKKGSIKSKLLGKTIAF